MQINKVITSILNKVSKPISKKIRIVQDFGLEPDYYLIKTGRKTVGNTTFSVEKNTDKIDSSLKFPQNWYDNSQEKKIKPFIWVNYIEILKDKKKGFGRKTMQALYELSCKEGCEGRIILNSLQQTAGFYSHVGFDCPIQEAKKYETIYAMCKEFAKNVNMPKNIFNKLLKSYDCPTKTNGKFNVAGIRFFNPIKENIEKLFK